MNLPENIKLVQFSYINGEDALKEGQRYVNTDIDLFHQIDTYLSDLGEYVSELMIDGVADVSIALSCEDTEENNIEEVLEDEIEEVFTEIDPLDDSDFYINHY